MSESTGVLALEHIPPMAVGETANISLDLELAEPAFGPQFRMISSGSSRLLSPMRVGVTEH